MTENPHSGNGIEHSATYREVFAVPELSALFGSFSISKAASMLARVAVTFLIFKATNSPLMSAAAYGLTYAPYLGPAQLLATLADRLPYRTTMVVADFLRVILIGLVALPGMPVPIMLILVFTSATVEPAYQASRSALLPKLVHGDVLTLAMSVYLTLGQTAQLFGYMLGGVIAAIDPHIALMVNSACFAVSGFILLTFVKHRPPDSTNLVRRNIFVETGQGFKLVFGNRVLRVIALVVFTTVTFTVMPEGAAASWAHELNGGAVLQGTIMASAPVATIVSSILFTRFTRPSLRQKLIRPLVLLAPAALIPALFGPSGPWVVVIAVVCNLTLASLTPLNAIFIKAVPDGFRARGFSVIQSGMAIIQGAAVVSVGVFAQLGLKVSLSIGIWGVAGTAVVLLLLVMWPSSGEFDKAVANPAGLPATTNSPPKTTMPTPEPSKPTVTDPGADSGSASTRSAGR